MYFIVKTVEVAACHRVTSERGSKCENLHGHNWIITVHCKSDRLDEDGMVVDFSQIKKIISDKLDHKNLNDVFNFSPTSENIAKWLVEHIPFCYRASVRESSSSEAIYEI
ncbi:MAG: 6-carboxytetrahydropterin synthase QueD [Rickettsiales bacterium]|jgi:6-pyruvoyltetrahydropterin/6-carboxytetrahydropterin synthase|nr:6-carboxytetrahydropterin synthase QueD [Rickettsiales bacterium]